MSESTSEPTRTDAPTLEASLTSFARRLTGAVPLAPGGILLRFTDTGERHRLGGTGRELRVAASAAGEPAVEIAGPSAVLRAILDGKKEASRAFVAGKIQVRGDLTHLETLLKDAGVLECGE